ncbi:hypothetical protein N9449_07345 [Oceanospirillaceae bacterium]|nr:hypothetical protein [Oceanospirillaceae bacterium]
MDALIYLSFDKGIYQGRYEGINLQFESLLGGDAHYCLFNAEVKYCRGVKAGQLLPSKQFRVGRRSDFLKFWQRTGLDFPPRLSSFHDYMGNLKPLFFTARIGKSERLEKKTLSLLSVSYDQIKDAYLGVLPDKKHTAAIQNPDNTHTRLPYKEKDQSQSHQGLRRNEGAGDLNHGTRLIGNAVIRENVIPISITNKLPQDQTVDEWLADYDAAVKLNFPNDFG